MKNGELVLCLNYGGHLEIADAVKKIVQSGVSAEEITPELIAQIYTRQRCRRAI